MKNKKLAGATFSILNALFNAAGGICAQAIFTAYPVDTNWLAPIRLCTAGVILLVIALLGKKEVMSVFRAKGDVRALIAYILFGCALTQYSFYRTIQSAGAAFATVMMFTSPIFVLLWTLLKQKRGPHYYELICVAFGIVGTFFCVTGGDLSTLKVSGTALFWACMSIFSFTCSTIIPRGIIARHGVLSINGWAFLAGGLVLSLICRPWSYRNIGWDSHLTFLMIGAIIIGTVCAMTFYQLGCTLLGGLPAIIIATLEPMVSILLSVAFFQAHFSKGEILGFVLIIIAVPTMTILSRGDGTGS